MRIALFLLLSVAVILLAMSGALTAMLRWVVRLAFAAALGLLAVVVLPIDEDTAWIPLAVFAGALIALSWRGRNDAPPARPVARDATPTPGRLDLGPDWPVLLDLADWRVRRRLAAAAETCGRYMAVAAELEDPGAQLPIKIGKHVPALVAECVLHSRNETADERRALVADTLATIEQVAGRADARRRTLARAAQHGFRSRQAHLARTED